jgi:hypothetical protein
MLLVTLPLKIRAMVNITISEQTSKFNVYSSNMQSGFFTGSLEIKGFELPRNLCYIAVIKGPDISS